MSSLSMSSRHSPVVSFDDEPLILVDAQDNEVGYRTKAECHNGEGLLHRAFSVFLFNLQGELLLQQRSASKRLWPLYWANSCCSHPRRGEATPDAAARRTREELSLGARLEYLFKFTYQVPFESEGAEHELCWVFAGRVDGLPRVNANEIAATRFVAPEALDHEMVANPERYTPWLKIEWPRLRAEHWSQVEALLGA
ncbi:MAG TPA: isopentenyl-diphosphate Delta-isomerase [Myxococcota bacterium]|nr:isopentenyl-diphosphate Delta-isomerase [Myxococcota bacterium]